MKAAHWVVAHLVVSLHCRICDRVCKLIVGWQLALFCFLLAFCLIACDTHLQTCRSWRHMCWTWLLGNTTQWLSASNNMKRQEGAMTNRQVQFCPMKQRWVRMGDVLFGGPLMRTFWCVGNCYIFEEDRARHIFQESESFDQEVRAVSKAEPKHKSRRSSIQMPPCHNYQSKISITSRSRTSGGSEAKSCTIKSLLSNVGGFSCTARAKRHWDTWSIWVQWNLSARATVRCWIWKG